MFQRRKVAVKVLLVKKQESPNTSAKENLKREAENLTLLNKERHAKFPVLLAYDTKTLPYHLITAFEKSGDLLQFLRRSRGRNPPLQPVQLIKMLLNITDALIHLEKKGLVHRAVMATNVLVGDSYICKLSGLQHLRQLTSQNEYSDSLYSYCPAEDGCPDYVNSTDEEELPLRWKAPEVLSECRFSTASDVWALGVLMYEVLTYGCLPFRHISDDKYLCSQVKNGIEILPFERCFEEEEYQLMRQCFQFHRHKRPKLLDVQKSLCEMNENADEEQARFDPPSLDLQVTYESPARNVEDINSFYSGLYYVHNLMSDEERAEEKSSNSDLEDLPRKIRLISTSESAFSEKIKRTDDHHLRGLLALNHANLVAI
ncbi:ephrin type-A receptor 4a-like isoform X3 [Stylophora pistillata]|uniref:ephrin type-A receptor 4a-like isoform X3 n=1 Tax=Stylophora pistillata TaxID=50429 RepID=UPI000C054733|nr:ephrin type-A receptor 4a-like isoform X3 [Stylophora pistillata]